MLLCSEGFSSGSAGKDSPCQCRQCKRHGFDTWVGKIPWRRKWQPTPVFLPGKFHGQRSLAVYSPWGRRVEHNWAHRPAQNQNHRAIKVLGWTGYTDTVNSQVVEMLTFPWYIHHPFTNLKKNVYILLANHRTEFWRQKKYDSCYHTPTLWWTM